MLSIFVEELVLWIHLFSAILFIGGSFFMWTVLLPSSHTMGLEESSRTKIVGTVAKRFAIFTHTLIGILVVTGLLLAFVWFLPAPSALFTTVSGRLLGIKMILVLAMILLTYGNNIYHGKRMMAFAREGKLEELARLRRRSHLLSYITLGLMLLITVLGVILVG